MDSAFEQDHPETKWTKFRKSIRFVPQPTDLIIYSESKTVHFSVKALAPRKNIQKSWHFGYEILPMDPWKWDEKDPNPWTHGRRLVFILGGFTMDSLLVIG